MPAHIWSGKAGQSKVRPGRARSCTHSRPFVGLTRGVPRLSRLNLSDAQGCLEEPWHRKEQQRDLLRAEGEITALSRKLKRFSPLVPSELQ